MYLLDTSTLKLHYFIGKKNIPPYAILSHRWEEEEVSFKDLQDGKGSGLRGWSKIQRCCAQAVADGLSYAWVDTCCIDKSSSAELSEAINSMFRWYQDSKICYAYLSDVDIAGKDLDTLNDEFAQSKWFTRGWTLQELIAPRTLVFFDREWKFTWSRYEFRDVIEEVTGVAGYQYASPLSHKWATIAERMSWASRRETTREEDTAYCLMGLFGVNMPLLYGEGGEEAFYRLQLEILKRSDDESIFFWNQDYFSSNAKSTELAPCIDLFPPYQVSPFASSPELFRYSQFAGRRDFRVRDDYSVTNKGLYIHLTDTRVYNSKDGRLQLMIIPLNCAHTAQNLVMYLFTLLWGIPSQGPWYRWGPVHPARYDFDDDDRRIYISGWPDPRGDKAAQPTAIEFHLFFEPAERDPEFRQMFKPLYDYLASCPQPSPWNLLTLDR